MNIHNNNEYYRQACSESVLVSPYSNIVAFTRTRLVDCTRTSTHFRNRVQILAHSRTLIF